jgi:hypothetical protein
MRDSLSGAGQASFTVPPGARDAGTADEMHRGGNMHATCGDRPLLGSVLVEQGVVERDDVEEAVEAQSGSGERLGEVLVGRGLICRAELDRAIATQSGLELDEEAGFGSGLRAAIERRHRDRRDLAVS